MKTDSRFTKILAELALRIPENVSVQVHENTPKLMNVVLPEKPAEIPEVSSSDPVSAVIRKAWTDASYKSLLLSDPKEAASQMGVSVPDAMAIKVWENTPSVQHLVLPINPADSELSDSDLEAVAGGAAGKGTQQPSQGPCVAVIGFGGPSFPDGLPYVGSRPSSQTSSHSPKG